MSRKIAFMYAGQGSQKVGMGKDLYDSYPEYKSALEEVDPTGNLRELSFNADEKTLADTRNTQPCMVAMSYALTKLLESRGIVPELALGLSLGEYSALCTAGVFTGTQAVELVSFRAERMAECVVGMDSAMVAVIGTPIDIIEKACDTASSLGVCEIANYNSPAQTVVAGEVTAVNRAAELMKESGAKRCIPLNVSGPFHTSLLKSAGEALGERLKTEKFGELNIPVIFNATANTLQQDESIKDLLVRQVSSSVRFEQSIRLMDRMGIDTAIEIGFGGTLSGFVKKTVDGISCISVCDVASFEKALGELD